MCVIVDNVVQNLNIIRALGVNPPAGLVINCVILNYNVIW
jgi:hypothetical protein